MTPSASVATPSSVSAQLVAALELAANEMRAVESATTLAEAQAHAEIAVNVLVGKFGRWYGDQNGDGFTAGPTDMRGVLPSEKSPVSGADLDQPQQFPFGLAFLAAGRDTSSPALTQLLGDPTLWSTKPREGYNSIATAMSNVATAPQLNTLKGEVPRAVAFGRLVFTNAPNVSDAHAFAAEAVKELDSAVQAARTMP